MRPHCIAVVILSLAVGFAHRERLRAEVNDAPDVFGHSATLKWLGGDERVSTRCMRCAPPDTAIRRIVRKIDDEVTELRK